MYVELSLLSELLVNTENSHHEYRKRNVRVYTVNTQRVHTVLMSTVCVHGV